MVGPAHADLPIWIADTIARFCTTSPANSLTGTGGEPSWGTPIVGFSRGDDAFYERIRADIGPFLWTPQHAFSLACPGISVTPRELSVISWILPQTEATLADQRAEDAVPSERWCRTRHFGEKFNETLRAHLVSALQQIGIAAVAPALLPDFAYQISPRFGLASNWSERHVAFISGLGTFGLSDGLITPLGKAIRCGSVVARVELPATPRHYDSHQEWCLHAARGSCMACARRCPAGAIDETGHDKQKCYAYIREVTAPYARNRIGIDVTPCGLCQTRVPCERGIPPGVNRDE